MHSLSARLLVLWLLSLVACVAVGVLLVQLYGLSTAARTGRAELVVARACDLMRARFDAYAGGWPGQPPPLSDPGLRRDLGAVVMRALARMPEVEGGIWQQNAGPLAYAFPTYPGEGPKTDLPAAEEGRIRAANERVARDGQPVTRVWTSPAETLLIGACPLAGPVGGMTGWAMTRVRAAPGYGRLGTGLAVLAGFVLGGAAWLTSLAVTWSRRVRAIEATLARAGADGIPAVARTGERELDRIVDALNDAGRRLAEQRHRSDELAVQVATAERLAALGRVAAGVAHEIRNPLAAMRLRAENALATADEARPRLALADMLDQIARLDGLVTELLAMTQRRAPHPVRVALRDFVECLVGRHRDTAARAGIALECASPAAAACLDPEIAGRILDNLVLNALRHTPRGGRVRVSAELAGARLRVVVADTGAGVAPELRGSLFEPFTTGRADGIGLGLAIARELAAAHGGTLLLLRPGGGAPGEGAAFAVELPVTLPAEPACPPS